MRILFFTYRLPYPPLTGGQTRAFNLIKGISSTQEVTLFSFIKKEEELKNLDEMRKYCSKIMTFKRRDLFSPLNLPLTIFSKMPFASALYYSSVIEGVLKEELANGKYDWVHFESFYPSVYLNNITKTKTLMGNENAEYLVYKRFSDSRIFPLNKIFSLDVAKMKKYEEVIWKKATLNIAVSETDAKLVESVTGSDCPVIPNGVDTDFFSDVKRIDDGNTLLYVGSFRYIQNQDAVSFFLKKIWPLIKEKKPKVKVLLVGRDPTSEILKLRSQSIEVASNIDDIRKAYEIASALIVPIRAASGTRLKILEAMASSVPVVSTKVGVEGIEAKKDQEVLIADDPKSFAQETINILEDSGKRAKITLSAKNLVDKKYSWKKIAQDLNYLYEKYS